MAAITARKAVPRAASGHSNEVRLVGRLAGAAVAKVLPSGDELVTWRLVVDRPETTARGATRREVDTVTCTATAARVRRQALTWAKDDVIEVAGALRSRFWRGAGGVQSRVEVEARTASRQAAGLRRRRMPG